MKNMVPQEGEVLSPIPDGNFGSCWCLSGIWASFGHEAITCWIVSNEVLQRPQESIMRLGSLTLHF